MEDDKDFPYQAQFIQEETEGRKETDTAAAKWQTWDTRLLEIGPHSFGSTDFF